MAKDKTTSSAPTTLTPPVVPPTPPAPQAPEAAAEGKKKGRVEYKEVFASAEEAEKEANSREKGPRRAFSCKFGDDTIFVVANNEGRAGGVAFRQLGGSVTEIGKKAAAGKPVSVGGIMESINALPEAERAAVLAQLKAALPGS